MFFHYLPVYLADIVSENCVTGRALLVILNFEFCQYYEERIWKIYVLVRYSEICFQKVCSYAFALGHLGHSQKTVILKPLIKTSATTQRAVSVAAAVIFMESQSRRMSFMYSVPGIYSKPCQISKMQHFTKIVNDCQLVANIAKSSILDV